MGMRGGLFPAQTQAHLIQQAQMARMQAQRHQHTQEHRISSRGQAMKLSSSIVREARNQMKGLDPENMYIECPLCHKRIKRLYHFQRHMRIHSGEKSHQCPYCPYKSVRKDNLKSHLKTHEKHALEARRNAEMLDKKRNNEFEAIRRLHLTNGMKKIQMPTAMQQMACNATNQAMRAAMSNHGCCGGGSVHAHAHTNCCSPPTLPQKSGHPLGFESFSMKEEPVAEVTEIDSGCESPQEQPSPLVNI
jgi:DNA-directed RNA polymerase subunit RPC12/RpoP